VNEQTTFDGVNKFRNGGIEADFFGPGNDLVLEYGLLSMLDGGVGDRTSITHDFFGSQSGDGTYSTLAMDINFANTMGYRSDYLDIEEEIDGATAVIFNRISPEASTTVLGDRIYFAESEYRSSGNNAFFIDPNSDNYIVVDGIAAIQDGLYAWYEDESGGVGDDYEYYLQSAFAPQAAQLPSLITAAQNIWHDTAGQVADHIYGNHFPLSGSGGGGADLSVGELPVDASAAPSAALWAKATGSWTDRNTEVVQEILPAVPVTIDTSFVQNTFSILAGADFQPMGGGEDGLRAGVFGGYVSSSLEFDSYGASADFAGGIVGAYAAYTMGGFYADAEVKADLLQVTYSAPISPGFEATGASTSIGILANTGYRMEVGDSAFFEPIASLSFVSTELEGFDAGGASVEFSNGNSLQGGIGARAGVTLGTPGDTTTEVSVLGKIWNEFEDANVVTVTDGLGNSASFSDGINGVFGELSGSATVYSADKTFSAFGSAGVKFNESFTTVDAKVGVRKGF
jgi:outer membrane autotransporter protein